MVSSNGVVRTDDVSVAEAARLLGISRSTLYRRIDKGAITVRDNGSTWSIRRSDLTKMLRDEAREASDKARRSIEQIKAAS